MTVWKRLRLFEVPPRTDQAEALRLADKITSDSNLTEDERRTIARFLRQWRPASSGRGRRRDSNAPYIALDYLVQKELLGKASAAQADIAVAWRVARDTVKDAWTDWQTFARWKLDELTKERVGRTRRMQEAWTRRTLLEDISADLRDSHAPKGRRK